MAAIKSYTDISQSKTLSKILPLESADMYWWYSGKRYYIEAIDDGDFNEKGDIRAWSLAALLDVLPDGTNVIKEDSDTENEHYMCTVGVTNGIISTFGNNPVDACVAMVEKLNELNLL